MNTDSTEILSLDCAAATEMLERGANRAHLKELDERIAPSTPTS